MKLLVKKIKEGGYPSLIKLDLLGYFIPQARSFFRSRRRE